eukprot:3428132-Rhodomonas_salina.3
MGHTSAWFKTPSHAPSSALFARRKLPGRRTAPHQHYNGHILNTTTGITQQPILEKKRRKKSQTLNPKPQTQR